MDQIIIQTLHGLVNGMVLAMVASGLTLIFGIMDIVNFAHGDLLMLGAFVGATVLGMTGSYWLALIVAAIVIAILGALLQITTLRPLIGRDPLTTILATFGVSLVVQKYALWQWGPSVRQISVPVGGDFNLFYLQYPWYRIVTALLAGLIITALWLFLKYGKYGIWIRATTQDRVMAQAMGIPVPLVYTAVFAIGSAMAAASGVLFGPFAGVTQTMGFDFTLRAFIVVVVGGMGNLGGSILASIFVSLLESYAAILVSPAQAVIVSFVVLVLTMLFRPTGLFAMSAVQTRTRAAGYWTAFAIVVAVLLVAPLVLPPFWQRFVTEILIWGLLAMSSDILIGYTGMVSFGHSAFFGLGMYGAAAALLTVKPPSLWLALLYGLVAAGGVAVFVAFFATRLRDIYFAISTLVFSQIFYVIIFTWTEVTGGENGLTFRQPRLSILGLWSDTFTPTTFHWFVLTVVVLSYLLVRRITQSPFGMVLQSIRENEPRTRAIGYHVERYKIVAVMLSGLFAGLAGVLYAIQNKFAAPDFVFFVVSGEVVIFNVMGGMGTLVGPFAGAAFFLLLREGLSRFMPEYYLIPVGIIFIIMIIFLPQGLLGFLRRRLNS